MRKGVDGRQLAGEGGGRKEGVEGTWRGRWMELDGCEGMEDVVEEGGK